MKLLLTSNGLANDEIIATLRQLSGRPFESSSVAFVPTASDLDDGDKSWLIDDMMRFRRLNFASLDIVDVAALPADVTVKRLEAANIVAVGGGDPYHLLDRIDEKSIRSQIVDLLETRVYIGISAGSQAAGPAPSLASESSLFGELGGNQDPLRDGLGLCDVYFRPHLDSPSFPCAGLDVVTPIAKQLPGRAYALDDDTALAVVDDKIEIVGSGRALLLNG